MEGAKINEVRLKKYLDNSLMLVTALSPVIGYDKAAMIAHKAMTEGTTLKTAALASGFVDEEEFNRIVDPRKMIPDR